MRPFCEATFCLSNRRAASIDAAEQKFGIVRLFAYCECVQRRERQKEKEAEHKAPAAILCCAALKEKGKKKRRFLTATKNSGKSDISYFAVSCFCESNFTTSCLNIPSPPLRTKKKKKRLNKQPNVTKHGKKRSFSFGFLSYFFSFFPVKEFSEKCSVCKSAGINPKHDERE